MNFLRLLNARPIATSLLVLAFVITGFIAYLLLPVAYLPSMSIPTIQVVTTYPGASPDVMASHVTAPLENQLGKMDDVSQMSSMSSYESSRITIQFSQDLDLDIAGQEVQAAINAALTYLPTDLPTPPLYFKINPTEAPILILGLTSKTLPLPQVNTFAESRIVPIIAELSGIGRVSLEGGQTFAVRIQVNLNALAANNLSLEDVRTAISNANILGVQGSFDGPRLSYTLNSNDQLITAKDYQELIIAYQNNAPLRLKDIATVINATENSQAAVMSINQSPAVTINIQGQPGSNTMQIVGQIKELLPQIKHFLPISINMSVVHDSTTNMLASLHEMKLNLLLAFLLVMAIIYFYSRSIVATIIASITIPISLITTCGCLYLLGGSLDNITLIALTLSMGLVVNNAFLGMAVISRQVIFLMSVLTISLIVSLAPQLFVSGEMASLFREFAITVCCAVIISSIVSLTFIPMLCSRFLKIPMSDHVSETYTKIVQWALQHTKFITNLLLISCVFSGILFYAIPKNLLLPDQAAYQYTLSSPENSDLNHWLPLVLHQLQSLKSIKEVRIDQSNYDAMQTHLKLDRNTASRLGITAEVIDNVLYDAFGQRQISTVYTQSNQYHIILEALPSLQKLSTGLNAIYFSSSAGPIPLTTFTRASQTFGPSIIHRKNQFPAATISFKLSPNIGLHEATLDIATAVKHLNMPEKIAGSFDNTVQVFQNLFSDEAWLLLATVVLVYIVFGILYESLVLPTIILSTLPISLMSALFALLMTHQTLNTLSLLGSIMVMGMGMKNAIIILNAALELQKQPQKTVYDAIYQACSLNYKSMMLTSLTSLVAAIPLVMGKELHRPMAIAIIGGLVFSQYLTMLTVPAIYIFFSKYVKSS